VAREIVRPDVGLGLDDLAGKKAAIEITNKNFTDEVLSYVESATGVEGSREFFRGRHGNSEFGFRISDFV